MRRVQVSLTEDQIRYLEDRAQETGQPVTAVVRDAIDVQRAEKERLRRWESALSVIGKYASGQGDISENHDEYYVQTIEERIGRR